MRNSAAARRHRKRRPTNSRRLKNHLWYTTHGTAPQAPCHWCGKPMSFNEATVDHEPPLAEGGSRYSAVLACWPCNGERGKATSRRCNTERMKAAQ